MRADDELDELDLSSIPDARDGLTRKERVVLWVMGQLQARNGGRSVPTTMLYGRVVEHVDMSIDELQAILQRLGALRVSPT